MMQRMGISFDVDALLPFAKAFQGVVCVVGDLQILLFVLQQDESHYGNVDGVPNAGVVEQTRHHVHHGQHVLLDVLAPVVFYHLGVRHHQRFHPLLLADGALLYSSPPVLLLFPSFSSLLRPFQAFLGFLHTTGLPWSWWPPAWLCPQLGCLALVYPVGLCCSILPKGAGHWFDEVVLIHEPEHAFQAIAGAERGRTSLQRPAPNLPDHMAGVVGVRLDFGTGDAPESPLGDEPGRQEVVVEAQVEFQGLSFVMQFVEGKKLAPGGRGPSVEGSVGQVIGQE